MIQHRKRGWQISDELLELSVERLDISVLRLSCQTLEVMGDLRVYQKANRQHTRGKLNKPWQQCHRAFGEEGDRFQMSALSLA